MEKVKEIAKTLNILPKLRLGIKQAGGGVKSTGAHRVKFVAEPTVVMGRDHEGKERKELRFVVEENGQQYRWNVPIFGKDGQPSYLIERLMHIEVGDERILEMTRHGAKNYIDVRAVDAEPEPPDDEELFEHND